MATVIIPTSTELALYFQNVELDATVFQLVFRFNDREGFWYLDINDVEGNRIRSGIKLVVAFPLLRLIAQTPRPEGEMVVVDTTSSDAEAGLNDLGGTSLLAYEEAS